MRAEMTWGGRCRAEALEAWVRKGHELYRAALQVGTMAVILGVEAFARYGS